MIQKTIQPILSVELSMVVFHIYLVFIIEPHKLSLHIFPVEFSGNGVGEGREKLCYKRRHFLSSPLHRV